MSENIFDKFPKLESARLCLREIKPIDTSAIYSLYSDGQVMQHRGEDTFKSTTEALNLIQKFKKQFNSREGIRWGIALRDKQDELIGSAGLKNIHWQHYRGEIGYELAPSLWNKGLMTEALAELTAYCFRELDLFTLEANIAPSNIASERVLQKLGFKKEAHYKENYFYKKWWDSVIYTLHRK